MKRRTFLTGTAAIAAQGALVRAQAPAVPVPPTSVSTHVDTIPVPPVVGPTDWYIPPGNTLTLNGSSVYRNLVVGGELVFQCGAKLTVETCMGLPGSIIRTDSDRCSGIEVIFADAPIDVGIDPFQWHHGLLSFGSIKLSGQAKTPYTRCAKPLVKGGAVIHLAAPPLSWAVGDTIAIPGSRQLPLKDVRRSNGEWAYSLDLDWAEIKSIDGTTVNLVAPLKFDHPGVTDHVSGIEYLPHAVNTTRGIRLRSANASGHRGHVAFIGPACVEIRGVAFIDLGRTRSDRPIDSTTTLAGGGLHVGTNQLGRYACHFHHVHGSMAEPGDAPNAHQFTIEGCAITRAAGWGLTVHASHYGLIEGNVVIGAHGSGFCTEDGSETGNVFRGNLAAGVDGTFADNGGHRSGKDANGNKFPEIAVSGSGFWFSSPASTVENNIAAGCRAEGYVENASGRDAKLRVPSKPGQDPAQYVTRTTIAPGLFDSNEAYGCDKGYLSWKYQQSQNTRDYVLGFRDRFTIWNVHTGAVDLYNLIDLHIRELVAVNSPEVSTLNSSGRDWFNGAESANIRQVQGINFGFSTFDQTYPIGNTSLLDSHIVGFNCSVKLTSNTERSGKPTLPVVVHGCTLSGYINILADGYRGERDIEITGTVCLPSLVKRTGSYLPAEEVDLWLRFTTTESQPLRRQTVKWDGRRFWMREQAADYMHSAAAKYNPAQGQFWKKETPAAFRDVKLFPGRTNAELLSLYGYCVADELAPDDAVPVARVIGLGAK